MFAGSNVKHIVDRARAGKQLDAGEIRELFSVPTFSEEAFYIQFAAREMSQETSDGKAEIHGQIGIDNNACSNNCLFCSFAACNRVFQKQNVMSFEEILEKVQNFEKNGANAIYLMTTASFQFEKFIKIVREIKRHLKEDTVLIANLPDFGYQEAWPLKTPALARFTMRSDWAKAKLPVSVSRRD